MQIIGVSEPEEIGIWPENLKVVRIFGASSSKLNPGLEMVFRMHGVTQEEELEVFDGLRVMENAVYKHLNTD